MLSSFFALVGCMYMPNDDMEAVLVYRPLVHVDESEFEFFRGRGFRETCSPIT
jgi:hypothetical protein